MNQSLQQHIGPKLATTVINIKPSKAFTSSKQFTSLFQSPKIKAEKRHTTDYDEEAMKQVEQIIFGRFDEEGSGSEKRV